MASPEAGGIIAGGARILREAIRTPRVARTVRILLGNLDPESAPELVRAVMRQDPVLFLDLISATPKVVNCLARGATEVGEQLLALPDGLMDRLLPRLLDELAAERLGEAAGLIVGVFARLATRESDTLGAATRKLRQDLARGWSQGLARTGVDQAAVRSGARAAWRAIRGLVDEPQEARDE